ncbi:MAG: UbiA family prenyltransferase [Phycisphaeraceae bacterium]
MNLRALLELCRISNLPTVWSNVALGLAIGTVLSEARSNRSSIYSFPLVDILLSDPLYVVFTSGFLLGISLIYCSGMVLNDFADRNVDAIERPTRPIPSGRITARQALGITIVMLIAGFVISGGWLVALISSSNQSNGLWIQNALLLSALIACVVLYNYIHQAKAASVFLMGMCRSLAFLTPALFMHGWPITPEYSLFIIGPAVTLFLYTLAISIVARREMETKRFAGPKTIMNMIAAMPLLDAIWLIVMGLWPVSLFCVACAGLTKLAHRKVAGS